jgi:protein-disulfide isomerase
MYRSIVPAALGVVLLGLTLAPALSAQSQPELREEIEALKKGQEQIQKDLAEIKKLLAQRPAPRPAAPQGPNVKGKTFDLGTNPVLGEKGAAVTLVEFTDYQ